MIWTNEQAGILSYIQAAAADGTVGVVVHGNPFSGPAAETAEAVAAAMEASGGYGPPADYQAVAPDAVAPEPYFVVMFDPPVSQPAWRLCEGASEGGAGQENEVRLQVAFCSVGKELASVEGALPRPARADGPELRRWLGTAMMYLLPSEDPQFEDSDASYK